MIQVLRRLRALVRRFVTELRLELLRARLWDTPAGAEVTIDDITVRVTDGVNAYMQYKDEVVRRVYAFETSNPAPVVIDGGANVGMFTIATRRDHPGARITAFEPDPAVFALLKGNLQRNGVTGITLVNAALGAVAGEASFAPDGEAGGALSAAGSQRVRVETLSAHLVSEVDFIKLNIEGAEGDVLREAAMAKRLRNARVIVLEYHGWPDGPQRLGEILTLFDAEGFRYTIHDFDDQSNPVTKPPFRPQGMSPWFVLVHAWRVGDAPSR